MRKNFFMISFHRSHSLGDLNVTTTKLSSNEIDSVDKRHQTASAYQHLKLVHLDMHHNACNNLEVYSRMKMMKNCGPIKCKNRREYFDDNNYNYWWTRIMWIVTIIDESEFVTARTDSHTAHFRFRIAALTPIHFRTTTFTFNSKHYRRCFDKGDN